MILVVVANVVAWGVFHAATGWYVHRLPVERLQHDGPVLRLRAWERDGTVHARRLHIKRWKDRVPEAGSLFAGGVSKRTLGGDLHRFIVETRRAERGHWLAMACGPLALVWNPPIGGVVMVSYGVLVNAPFIAIQRYNRARATRALARSSGSRSYGAVDRSRSNGSSMP